MTSRLATIQSYKCTYLGATYDPNSKFQWSAPSSNHVTLLQRFSNQTAFTAICSVLWWRELHFKNIFAENQRLLLGFGKIVPYHEPTDPLNSLRVHLTSATKRIVKISWSYDYFTSLMVYNSDGQGPLWS